MNLKSMSKEQLVIFVVESMHRTPIWIHGRVWDAYYEDWRRMYGGDVKRMLKEGGVDCSDIYIVWIFDDCNSNVMRLCERVLDFDPSKPVIVFGDCHCERKHNHYCKGAESIGPEYDFIKRRCAHVILEEVKV